jgi:hypothetical protein
MQKSQSRQLRPLQILQEELAKYKQQSEKARVQKLQQVSAYCCQIFIFNFGWQARSMQGKSPFGSSSNTISGGVLQDEFERPSVESSGNA